MEDKVEYTSEDRHIAGHAFHAKSVDEATDYIAHYRISIEYDIRQKILEETMETAKSLIQSKSGQLIGTYAPPSITHWVEKIIVLIRDKYGDYTGDI